jgi:heat shock protein HslJ
MKSGTILILSLVVAVGCSEAPPPARPADPEAAFRARLGQQWELVRLGSIEIPKPPLGTPADAAGRDLVPGRRPTIRFSATTADFGGRSFCNGYGGPFELRGDSLRLGQIMSSAVGCDGPDSLETRFFRALRETRRFEIDSATLHLIAGDGSRAKFSRGDSTVSYP